MGSFDRVESAIVVDLAMQLARQLPPVRWDRGATIIRERVRAYRRYKRECEERARLLGDEPRGGKEGA